MSLQVQVAHSVQEIGQEAWDRLAGDRPFARYRWQRFGERVLADNLPVYVVVWRRDEPVAGATFWLRHNEPVPLSSWLLRGGVARLMRRWPLLICQAPVADAPGLLLPEPPLRDEALGLIARQAAREARRLGASFSVFVYLDPAESRLPGWPANFGAADLPEPGTYLSIAWPTFKDYVAHLSKSMRKDYRRHNNRAADLGVQVSCGESVADLDGAVALIRNVERHHGSTPNPWARAALQHAAMVDAAWLRAEVDGRLVGCGLVLGDGSAYTLRFLGLDYEVQYVYFQLLYAAIRWVVERGGRVLFGGAGGYEIKRRLGFELEDRTWAVFRGRGALLGRLGAWLASMEENGGQDPDES